MSGIEVFGANGTALSLIQMTRNKLGRARRVGRNIGDLRISLGDLLELRPHVDSGKDADLFARIESLVGEATELLEENHGTGPVASMRFLWTNSLDSDVERISHKVSSVYNVLNQRVRHRQPTELSPEPHHIDPPPPRRTSSNRPQPVGIVPLPTMLYLYDVEHDLIREPIALERFCILERDYSARFRTLLYESADQSVIVTHEIRFGTIPSTPDDIEAREVAFLDLETENEYAIYKLEPLYKFHDAAACNEFTARVRERTLLATFHPREISKTTLPQLGPKPGFVDRLLTPTSRDVTLARWKVVRLWERDMGLSPGPLTTMTFHDRSKNPPLFTEWSLKDFRETALTLKHGRMIKLSRYRRNEQFMFLFQSQDEAKFFKETIERKHSK